MAAGVISNDLLSSTLQDIMGETVDQLYKTTPILDLSKKLGAQKVDNFGTKIIEPWATTTHSTLSALPNTTSRLNMTVQNVLQPAEFFPANMGAPVFISRSDEGQNAGDKAVVKLAQALLTAVMNGARREINLQLLAQASATGIAAGLGSFYGHGAGLNTGLLEGRAVGSQVNVVGGVSKAGTPRGFHNAFQDAQDDFSVFGLPAMEDLALDIRTLGPFGEADLIIAKPAAFKNYKQTLFPGERWGSKDKLDGGRMNLFFGDAVMEPDPDMPDNSTNNFEASMYFLNTKAYYIAFWTGGEFDLGPFRDCTGDQIGRMAHLFIQMQLVARSLASMGFLGDGNTN